MNVCFQVVKRDIKATTYTHKLANIIIKLNHYRYLFTTYGTL